MLLPAQGGRAEFDAVMLVAGLGRRQSAPGAEIGERRAIGFAALGRRLECELQHTARRLDRRERAGVNLAEHRCPQRVRFEPAAMAYGDLGGHAQRVARRPHFDKEVRAPA